MYLPIFSYLNIILQLVCIQIKKYANLTLIIVLIQPCQYDFLNSLLIQHDRIPQKSSLESNNFPRETDNVLPDNILTFCSALLQNLKGRCHHNTKAHYTAKQRACTVILSYNTMPDPVFNNEYMAGDFILKNTQ